MDCTRNGHSWQGHSRAKSRVWWQVGAGIGRSEPITLVSTIASFAMPWVVLASIKSATTKTVGMLFMIEESPAASARVPIVMRAACGRPGR